MKKPLTILFGLALLGLVVGLLIYNKPHKNMAKAKPDFNMQAVELLQAFEADETAANTRYLDKVIAVTGTVQDMETDEDGVLNIYLEAGNEMTRVTCQFDELSNSAGDPINIGQKVTIKGICAGMLMDVVLVRCVPVS